MPPLFGGALSCNIPPGWRDISNLVPVPDHQECFQSPSNDALVVEILNRHREVPDDQAALYFFTDLAENNGSPQAETTFSAVSSSSSTTTTGEAKFAGQGIQIVKGQAVRIHLCVWRLAQVNTEILVTLSSPVVDENSREQEILNASRFIAVCQSLKIHDWGLFGG